MSREGAGPAGPSRDRRRLALGLAFMAGFLLTALAAAFLLGRPPEDGLVAPGVPFLVAFGWVLVLGAAAVFYRTFPGDGPEEHPAEDQGDGERPGDPKHREEPRGGSV